MAYFPTYIGQDAAAVVPVIRRIEVDAIREALEKGVSDFWAMPSHAAFLALVYPLCGMVLAYAPSYQNALQLLFPLVSGFALVGPFVAVGLYEMSRQREKGLDYSWATAFDVGRSPSFGAIVMLGVVLRVIMLLWLAAAQAIYDLTLGPMQPASMASFVSEVFTTPRGG